MAEEAIGSFFSKLQKLEVHAHSMSSMSPVEFEMIFGYLVLLDPLSKGSEGFSPKSPSGDLQRSPKVNMPTLLELLQTWQASSTHHSDQGLGKR